MGNGSLHWTYKECESVSDREISQDDRQSQMQVSNRRTLSCERHHVWPTEMNCREVWTSYLMENRTLICHEKVVIWLKSDQKLWLCKSRHLLKVVQCLLSKSDQKLWLCK